MIPWRQAKRKFAAIYWAAVLREARFRPLAAARIARVSSSAIYRVFDKLGVDSWPRRTHRGRRKKRVVESRDALVRQYARELRAWMPQLFRKIRWPLEQSRK